MALFSENVAVSVLGVAECPGSSCANVLQTGVDGLRQETEFLYGEGPPAGLGGAHEPVDRGYKSYKRRLGYRGAMEIPQYLREQAGVREVPETERQIHAIMSQEGQQAVQGSVVGSQADQGSVVGSQAEQGGAAGAQLALVGHSAAQQAVQQGAASRSLVRAQHAESQFYVPEKPQWHAPWKLMRVMAGHQGWVRCLATEPENKFFASGSNDSTIKIWDLASGQLRLTLTGHIMTVRDIAISDRHPYMFSCSEDKSVKCWDLEKNKIIRDYHGHLSGVYSMDIHPTQNIIVTGSRDSTVKVWDIRTATEIFTLTGHKSPVTKVRCQATDPQIVSTSNDKTVRLWDLCSGKTQTVLTHHKKSIRALALHPTEYTFATGAPDAIKQWKFPEGSFMLNFRPAHESIINTLAINQDNVMFSGGDNGTCCFYDWKTGHKFQQLRTTNLPGSLDSECGIYSSTFDRTGMRLITGEADKSIKVWKEDETATPETHPGIPFDPEQFRDRY